MKKILTLIASFIFFSMPAYSMGINVGVSGTMGVFHATGEENENGEKSSDDATGVAAYGSIFIEKTLGDRLTVGLDYVPTALESETTEHVVNDLGDDGVTNRATNKIQVDFEDLTTLYLSLGVTDNLYLKAGLVQVDVITNESLGTGSTYANTDMDGTMLGLGYNTDLGDTGLFARIEGSYMDFGSASVTSSNTVNKVTLKDLEGASAKISIGKSF